MKRGVESPVKPWVEMKNRARALLSAGFVCVAVLASRMAAAAPALIPAPASEDALSVRRCVEIALQNHPSLAEARSSIESQAARAGQAASGGRPQLSLSPSYSYSRNEGAGQGGQYNTDLTLRQEIYDWGRRDLSIRGALTERDARMSDEADAVDTVIRNVMDAYFSLNQSNRAVQIASEREENYRRRLKWAQDFYRIGTKPKIEVTKAQTDLSNAKLDMVSAQGARGKAVAALASAMGVPSVTPEGVADALAFAPYAVALEDAVSEAMRNRSDLRALDVRVRGAATALALARKGLAPSVSGSAGYSFAGETDPIDERGWRLSLGVEFPVSDGGMTRGEIQQAEADLDGARARREAMRQNIVLQVRTAHAALEEATEAVSAAREVQLQAAETLDLAQGRYKAGVGESLEISDAVETYARARTSVVNALYNHKAAELELKRVTGVVADGYERGD